MSSKWWTPSVERGTSPLLAALVSVETSEGELSPRAYEELLRRRLVQMIAREEAKEGEQRAAALIDAIAGEGSAEHLSVISDPPNRSSALGWMLREAIGPQMTAAGVDPGRRGKTPTDPAPAEVTIAELVDLANRAIEERDEAA